MRPGLFPLSGLFLALALCATPASAEPADASDPSIGLYRSQDRSEIYIEYLPDIEGLVMVDFPEGRVRALHRAGAATHTFGPTIGATEPVVATIKVDGDRLTLTESGRSRSATRQGFRTEDVRFRNGSATLAGELMLPGGKGPFPAVVLMHGGGAQTRNFFWIPRFFAARGFAVLAYDKRGAGASTGDWRTSSNADLADDALAGVEWLGRRPDIRKNQIGLWGASAAGWTAPLAGLRGQDRIAFIIVRSGSALSERENMVLEVENTLRGAGYGDDVVARARRLHELVFAVSDERSEHSWERLRAALEQARTQPWFSLARLPGSLPAWKDKTRRPDIDFFIATIREDTTDPIAHWRQLRMPILFQVGGLDRYVPGEFTAKRLRAALADNKKAQVILYPRGDHPMFESTTGHPRDIPKLTHYAKGYLGDLDRFVRTAAGGDKP